MKIFAISVYTAYYVHLCVAFMKRVNPVFGGGSIDITPDGMKAIVTLSSGDMRRSLNILQVLTKACPLCASWCCFSFIFILCFHNANASYVIKE